MSSGRNKYANSNLNVALAPRQQQSGGPPRTLSPGLQALGGVKRSTRSPSSTAPKNLKVPPPVVLPSLKKEHAGSDPSTNIVPGSGTGGWNLSKPEEPAAAADAALTAASTWASNPARSAAAPWQPPVEGASPPPPPPPSRSGDRRLNPAEYPDLATSAKSAASAQHPVLKPASALVAAPAIQGGRKWVDDERDVPAPSANRAAADWVPPGSRGEEEERTFRGAGAVRGPWEDTYSREAYSAPGFSRGPPPPQQEGYAHGPPPADTTPYTRAPAAPLREAHAQGPSTVGDGYGRRSPLDRDGYGQRGGFSADDATSWGRANPDGPHGRGTRYAGPPPSSGRFERDPGRMPPPPPPRHERFRAEDYDDPTLFPPPPRAPPPPPPRASDINEQPVPADMPTGTDPDRAAFLAELDRVAAELEQERARKEQEALRAAEQAQLQQQELEAEAEVAISQPSDLVEPPASEGAPQKPARPTPKPPSAEELEEERRRKAAAQAKLRELEDRIAQRQAEAEAARRAEEAAAAAAAAEAQAAVLAVEAARQQTPSPQLEPAVQQQPVVQEFAIAAYASQAPRADEQPACQKPSVTDLLVTAEPPRNAWTKPLHVGNGPVSLSDWGPADAVPVDAPQMSDPLLLSGANAPGGPSSAAETDAGRQVEAPPSTLQRKVSDGRSAAASWRKPVQGDGDGPAEAHEAEVSGEAAEQPAKSGRGRGRGRERGRAGGAAGVIGAVAGPVTRTRGGRSSRGSKFATKQGSVSGGEDEDSLVEAGEVKRQRQPQSRAELGVTREGGAAARSRGRGRAQLARPGRGEKAEGEAGGPAAQTAAPPAVTEPAPQSPPAASTPYAWGPDVAKEVESMAQMTLASGQSPLAAVQKVDALTSFDPVASPKLPASESGQLTEGHLAVERPQSAAVARPKSAQSVDSLPSGVLSNGIPALPADLSLDTPASVVPQAHPSHASTGYSFQPPVAKATPAFPGTAFGGILWGQPGAANVWQQPPPLQPPPQPQQQQLQRPQMAGSFFSPGQQVTYTTTFHSQPPDSRGSLPGTAPLVMPQFGTFGQMGGFSQSTPTQFGQFGGFGQSPFIPTGKQPDWSVPGNPIAPTNQSAGAGQGSRALQQGFGRPGGADSFLPHSFPMPDADPNSRMMAPPGLGGHMQTGLVPQMGNGQQQNQLSVGPPGLYAASAPISANVGNLAEQQNSNNLPRDLMEGIGDDGTKGGVRQRMANGGPKRDALPKRGGRVSVSAPRGRGMPRAGGRANGGRGPLPEGPVRETRGAPLARGGGRARGPPRGRGTAPGPPQPVKQFYVAKAAAGPGPAHAAPDGS